MRNAIGSLLLIWVATIDCGSAAPITGRRLLSNQVGSHKLQPLPGNSVIIYASLPAPIFSAFTSAATTGGFLVGGTTYYYKISTYNGNGETTPFIEQSYTPPAGTSTNKITLTWGADAAAIGYNIYRSTTTGAELYLGTTTSATYTDSTNTVPAGPLPAANTTSWGMGNQTIALYHFDEGSGTAITDSSGNGYAGTLNGGATWTSEATRQNYSVATFPGGSALAMNGTSGYVSVPNLFDAAPASFTIAMTVRVPAGGLDTTLRYLFSKNWSATAFIHGYTFNGKVYFATNNFGIQISSSPLTWTANTTYGIIYTVTPSRIMIHRVDPATSQIVLIADSFAAGLTNALQVAPGSGSYFKGATPTAFTIGAKLDTGAYSNFTSLILDEWAIEDHPWTPDEINVRMVQWRTYNTPSAERGKWVRSNYPTLKGTQSWEGAGVAFADLLPLSIHETALLWEESTKRLHCLYSAAFTAPSIGYAYSDDYGQTWVKPLSSQVLGNGAGGVASGTHATHHAMYLHSDGYVYVSFNADDGNIYMAKSTLTTATPHTLTEVFTGGFTGGTGTIVLAKTAFSSAGPNGTPNQLGNSTLTYMGGTYYMAVEIRYPAPRWQTVFASCATINGTYTAIDGTMPASLMPPAVTVNNSTAPLLRYDATSNKIHLWIQYQNAPCDVWHYVTSDCSTFQQSTVTDSQPVLPLIKSGSTNTIYTGGFQDQHGDPEIVEVTGPSGGKRCIMMMSYLSNANATATNRIYTYTYDGTIASLTDR